MLAEKDCRICRSIIGYTQEQMAQAMFITKQSISDIEIGKTTKKSNILFINSYLKSWRKIILTYRSILITSQ